MSIMKEEESIISMRASAPGREKEGTHMQEFRPDFVASYTTLISLSRFGTAK
jgi:hypothetical protein